MEYVWCYTIINNVTARDRQEHHKQLYLGKSPDNFCPMVRIILLPAVLCTTKYSP
ncbi:hypothetical protein B0J14DRAFT_582945 [Halenospora varia]|nr:hypothetical protein B0J14DRAFT_582945 [Halenospora varia]